MIAAMLPLTLQPLARTNDYAPDYYIDTDACDTIGHGWSQLSPKDRIPYVNIIIEQPGGRPHHRRRIPVTRSSRPLDRAATGADVRAIPRVKSGVQVPPGHAQRPGCLGAKRSQERVLSLSDCAMARRRPQGRAAPPIFSTNRWRGPPKKSVPPLAASGGRVPRSLTPPSRHGRRRHLSQTQRRRQC
jgi:hypothetical protein